MGLFGMYRFFTGLLATVAVLTTEYQVGKLTHIHYSVYIVTGVIGLLVSAVRSQPTES